MSDEPGNDVDISQSSYPDIFNPTQSGSRLRGRYNPKPQLSVSITKPHMEVPGGVIPMEISTATDESNDWMESLLPIPADESQKQKIVRSNAFTQLVQGWEHYMGDDRMIDPFPSFQQPLQMLQGLSLCGHPATAMPGLKSGDYDTTSGLLHPLAPPALRHTHSSPSQIHRTSSVFDTPHLPNGDFVPPPPIALDPFQRSTSTPSAFRQHSNYSAFGKVDGSAFTSTYSYNRISSMTRESSGYSAFGPAQFYSMALEEMERTSIEVQDISDWSKDGVDDSPRAQNVGLKRGAASRAARFLSDVRVLRRRRRARGGRENPAKPASVSSSRPKGDATNDKETTRSMDTAVTIVTETVFNPNDTSFLSGSSELSALAKEGGLESATDCEFDTCTVPGPNMVDHYEAKDEMSPRPQQYQQLDSDVEEEVGYQRIETQLQSVSPPIPYFGEVSSNGRPVDEAAAAVSTARSMLVQVSSSQKPRFAMAMESIAASPSPTRMECGELSSLTPLSLESDTMSPHTTKSSVTGSSSGNTTQATNTSFGTGLQSGLSTISETDREVMEANKDAKRRRGLNSLPMVHKNETDGSSNNSASSNSTNPHRYFSLASSPVPLREGANVPVQRFFSNCPLPGPAGLLNQPSAMIRAQTTSSSTTSRRSESTTSPTTSDSVPVTHTSTSSASSSEPPPKFVSYLDREANSDLSSFREAMEISSQRAAGSDLEEREASPASQMMAFSDSDFLGEEPTAPSLLRGARLERFRSRQRPPRSPAKGVRPLKTPPPPGSVSPLYHQQLSPPRNIVDHYSDSSLSRPHVVRTGGFAGPAALATSRSLIDSSAWRLGQPIGVGLESQSPQRSGSLVKRRTYQENNVEVMDTGIGELVANLVTPEKDEIR